MFRYQSVRPPSHPYHIQYPCQFLKRVTDDSCYHPTSVSHLSVPCQYPASEARPSVRSCVSVIHCQHYWGTRALRRRLASLAVSALPPPWASCQQRHRSGVESAATRSAVPTPAAGGGGHRWRQTRPAPAPDEAEGAAQHPHPAMSPSHGSWVHYVNWRPKLTHLKK